MQADFDNLLFKGCAVLCVTLWYVFILHFGNNRIGVFCLIIF